VLIFIEVVRVDLANLDALDLPSTWFDMKRINSTNSFNQTGCIEMVEVSALLLDCTTTTQ